MNVLSLPQVRIGQEYGRYGYYGSSDGFTAVTDNHGAAYSQQQNKRLLRR